MPGLHQLLENLIQFKSITPDDAGCQEYMIDFLEQLGFVCQRFNNAPVANFFARYGTTSPLLVFAGHTDVVPIGDASKWYHDPFKLTAVNDKLYGRGTADMKGSLAAMMHMAERYLTTFPNFSGSLGFLITSGEEGDQFDQGTPYVMKKLYQQGIHIDYCIVGEPSSTEQVGDVIKIGRRGSLSGHLTLNGKQGHVAYPHLAINPIHTIAPVLAELTTKQWDNGNEFFPPTTFQITHIQSGGQASNIIPGELTIHYNFRFSTEQTTESLKLHVAETFEQYHLQPLIQWRVNGEPFLTSHGKLLDSCIKSIQLITGQQPTLSTSGGTSDGRFIAPYGIEVIELGPVNATIHQVNECIANHELDVLSDIYFEITKQLLQ